MTTLRSTFRLAALTAIPVELVNFFVVGYPTGPLHPLIKNPPVLLAAEWLLLHFPGIIALDRSSTLRTNHALGFPVLLAAGFLDTMLLIAAVLGIFRLLKRLFARPRAANEAES